MRPPPRQPFPAQIPLRPSGSGMQRHLMDRWALAKAGMTVGMHAFMQGASLISLPALFIAMLGTLSLGRNTHGFLRKLGSIVLVTTSAMALGGMANLGWAFRHRLQQAMSHVSPNRNQKAMAFPPQTSLQPTLMPQQRR